MSADALGPDTMDILKPLAKRQEERERDLPARRLIYGGLAVASAGISALAFISATTDPTGATELSEARPLCTIAIVVGAIAFLLGVAVRIIERILDRGRERSKRDMEKVVADAAIVQMRREERFRMETEARIDRVEDTIAREAREAATRAVERQIPVIVAAVRRVMTEEREAVGAQVQELKERQADLERDLAAVVLRQQPEGKGVNGTVVPIRQARRDEVN